MAVRHDRPRDVIKGKFDKVTDLLWDTAGALVAAVIVLVMVRNGPGAATDKN